MNFTKIVRIATLFLFILTLKVSVFPQNVPTLPMHLEMPFAPMPYKAMGDSRLLYELHITSFRRTSVELEAIDVFGDAGTQVPIVKFDYESLGKMIGAVGAVKKVNQLRTIGPGERIVVFLEISIDRDTPIPNVLRHRLHIKRPGEEGSTRTLSHPGFSVDTRTPPIIKSPLRGKGWVSFNGVSNDTGHRRTIIPLNGRANLAQRFAIDWVKTNSEGVAFKDSPAKNENFYGYGEELIAVADGVITDLKDGIPDNDMATGKTAVKITIDTIGGNYVIVDIGNGYHAFYAHMIPGSLKVKVGDRVKAGDVLGRLGNSGNSDAPHLHFHITRGNSPLGAEGVPYLIEKFRFRGIVSNPDELMERKPWRDANGTPKSDRLFEIPVENSVVDFR